MLYTPHFLTGAAIVKTIPNPIISLPFVLISHILLDLIPHHDFEIKPGMNIKDIWEIGENGARREKKRYFLIGALAFDIILMSITFAWILLGWKNYLMLLGGILAILPDVVEQGLLILGKPLPSVQDKFQFRVSAKYGFISYPIVSLIALYLLTY